MLLTDLKRKHFTGWWMAIFYVLAAIKWVQGLWLFQFDPFMFSTRFDGTTWMFMQTGLHLAIINHHYIALALDCLFYGLPIVYFITFFKNPRFAPKVAWVWLVTNWIYIQSYTLFPTNSIEAHIPWLLFPLLFCMKSLQSFYFILHGLRYFFLYFFFSAGVWKLVNGGAFELTQMSAILLDQHKDFLVTSPDYWQTKLIYLLISMPLTAFVLYWLGMLIELSFGLGFLSKRYDRMLLFFFLIFLVFDYLIMRIPYFEVTPFLLTLIFSKYENPGKNKLSGE